MVHEKFKSACIEAAPCTCHAPIVYTITGDDDTDYVTLFTIDSMMETKEIFSNIPEGMAQDNLQLMCTRCGKDWSAFNPLFFY